ncbi:hypothetical protein HUU05_02665 [candidate division KSB1 bacterium]|nr:hypothetical protein [candidate division KSB1 bacterium]
MILRNNFNGERRARSLTANVGVGNIRHHETMQRCMIHIEAVGLPGF